MHHKINPKNKHLFNMKTKFNYLFLLIGLAFAAPKANGQSKVASASPILIQFWDFNQIRPITGVGGDSLGTAFSYTNTPAVDSANSTWPLTADYTVGSLTKGRILYSRPTTHYSSIARDSIIDGVGPGGAWIYDYSQSNDSAFVEGNAYLKVRNPCDSAEVYMSIPTTGYKNISMEYAVSASSTKGANYSIFSYSTNGGVSWNNLTTAMDTFNIGGVRKPDTLLINNDTTSLSKWYPVQINFTADPSINNNALFVLRWRMAGVNSVNGSGNARFDNFAVWGTVVSGIENLPAGQAGYNVYPNPANNVVNVTSDNYTGNKVITLYNVVGQAISTTENMDKQTSINTSSLTSGVYFVEIKEVATGNKYTVKIVKE